MHVPKVKFLILSIQRSIIPVCFCLFTLFLITFSKDNLSAAKQGLSLWANSVVPSLLPFFIATELLSHTNIIYQLGNVLNGIMRPLFNVPGEGAFAFLMGIISGYPTGAKIVSNFKEKHICTKEECERLLAFTNNSGPLFIVGTVGASLFGDTKTGFLLLATHILACITVGFLFRFWKRNEHTSYRDYYDDTTSLVSFGNLGDVIGSSIKNATNTVMMIGGFVVLFSVITSMLHNSHFFDLLAVLTSPIFFNIGLDSNFLEGFYTGIIELTNGVQQICSIPTKNISLSILLCSFLLGFGGISVLLQVLSITSKSGISIKSYLIGKLLHGSFALLYTYLILANTNFFNLNI